MTAFAHKNVFRLTMNAVDLRHRGRSEHSSHLVYLILFHFYTWENWTVVCTLYATYFCRLCSLQVYTSISYLVFEIDLPTHTFIWCLEKVFKHEHLQRYLVFCLMTNRGYFSRLILLPHWRSRYNRLIQECHFYHKYRSDTIGVDLAGILGDAWRAPKVGRYPVEWGMERDVSSPADKGVCGSVVSSPSGVLGRPPAENGFWRISKATCRNAPFCILTKIWGGQLH